MKKYLSVILLCGGKGSRMGSDLPKQYLPLNNKAIALYSFDLFCQLDLVKEIIVVCDDQYKHYFSNDKLSSFASPGKRRQDSVYNGLQKVSKDSNLICIHDGARPFVKKDDVTLAITEAGIHGAAALGAKVKNTIKISENNFATKTLKREGLYEIYTPQIIQRALLAKGFSYAKRNNITVTDDLSLVELIGEKVKIIDSSYENIKITIPFDLKIAEAILTP